MAVLKSKHQFIYDASGKRAGVFLDIKTYESLLNELEMRNDVKAFDVAKSVTDAEVKAGQFVTIEDYTKNWKSRHAKRKGNSRFQPSLE
jgi:hypothetical protein